MATKPIEDLTSPEQATFRTEIGAQQSNSNLTVYANAADASARRALIDAAPKIEVFGYSYLPVPPSSGEVGSLRLVTDAAPGDQLCYWDGTEWLSASTGATPQAGE